MNNTMTNRVAEPWKESAYYDRVESEKALSAFWANNSIFYQLFLHLDTTHIVELACGHGRHVKKYFDNCVSISLVDINSENIEFCKNRFSDNKNIEYILTCGNNFFPIQDATKTAIFSYDSMVHFEMHDVDGYLNDAYRILVPDGKILLHHSNYAANPGGLYSENPGWRNFMSADIFAHLAIRAGFCVISQTIINWSKNNLDCISLCQIPST